MYYLVVKFVDNRFMDLTAESEDHEFAYNSDVEHQHSEVIRITNGHRRWLFPAAAVLYVEMGQVTA